MMSFNNNWLYDQQQIFFNVVFEDILFSFINDSLQQKIISNFMQL